jgi:DNA (cytosine-5)-methyltransferase 1
MRRPLLLDLFCCEGGAAMGYHRAGFDVIGVDIVPRPRYPFLFVQGDALRPPFDLSKFDAIHASPPCQAFSVTRHLHDSSHPDLIDPTRQMLTDAGVPFVIENVPGAPLNADLMLCGSMFGLPVRRHRYFETSIKVLILTQPCAHRKNDLGFAQMNWQLEQPGSETAYRDAMECDWMTARMARQAVPPAYTEFIGRQLIQHVS